MFTAGDSTGCCHATAFGEAPRCGGSIILIGAPSWRSSHDVLLDIVITKSAHDTVPRCLAVELHPDNIGCIVAPGFVPTDGNAGPHQAALPSGQQWQLLGRPTSTEDVANAIALIASAWFPSASGTTSIRDVLDAGNRDRPPDVPFPALRGRSPPGFRTSDPKGELGGPVQRRELVSADEQQVFRPGAEPDSARHRS